MARFTLQFATAKIVLSLAGVIYRILGPTSNYFGSNLTLCFQAFLVFPWWGYIVVALVFTHITIAAVTIYLHRHSAHRALDLHPVVSHFFRLWLWLTTGMETKQWTAIHRKHHARCETDEDPHSPQSSASKK